TPETKWDRTLLVEKRNDLFPFLQCIGDLIQKVRGGHRRRGENSHHTLAGLQCCLDRLIPVLPAANVQLVQPQVGSSLPQSFGEPEHDLRILAGVTEEEPEVFRGHESLHCRALRATLWIKTLTIVA